MTRFNVGGRFLELPANFSLQLKKKNILYSFDSIELERTTSFNVPASDKNVAILGWSNNFHRYGEQARKRIAAQLQLDGVTKDGYLYVSQAEHNMFECVFVTGELQGLADIKALGDWSQYVLPSNGVALDSTTHLASDSASYSAARINYQTDGDVMPSWLLPFYAEMVASRAGVVVDWGDALDKISGQRIVIGKARGVTETPATLTRTWLADQIEAATEYPTLNSVSIADNSELIGVVTTEVTEYPIFKADRETATQYYGQVEQFVANQALELYFGEDTPSTMFVGVAQQSGGFAFLGNYSFSYDGDTLVTAGTPLAGRAVELPVGQRFVLLTTADMMNASSGFEGWTISTDTLAANVTFKGMDEQAGSAYIRVKDNLPEMTIVEMLKTVAVLSGKVLSYKDGSVLFVDDVAGGSFRALDKPIAWTSLTRGVADYAQHNVIAFDSDEQILSGQKITADYTIDNVNISEHKELQVIPFSEGGVVLDIIGRELAYIRSDYDGYTLLVGEDGYIEMTRVKIPTNSSLQDVLAQGTSIQATVKMTERQFETLKYDMVLFFDNAPWIWIDATWNNGVSQLSLSKVGEGAIKPLPAKLPEEYQEVEWISYSNGWIGDETPASYPSPKASDPASALTFEMKLARVFLGNYGSLLANGMWFGRYHSICNATDPNGVSIPMWSSYDQGISIERNSWSGSTPNTFLIFRGHTDNNVDMTFSGWHVAENRPLLACSKRSCGGECVYGEVHGTMTGFRNYNYFGFIEANPILGCYAKLWDGNGNLLRNWIPCYRKSDLMPTFYDTVNDIIFPEVWVDTSRLIVGNEVIYDRPWE